eukprot:gene5432-5665_t
MPFTKLTMLSFTCSESTFKNPGPELAAVAALTTLTQLEMTKCKLPDAAFGHLTCLTRLSKLKLSGLWLMGDAGLAKIAEITSLSSLALSEAMHVTALGLMILSRLTALTSLALGLAQDLGSGSIARAANSLELLRCLEVNAPCWDDVDCHLLAASDGTLTKLELTSQTNVHVGQMRRVLSFFPQLQALDLSGCQELGESLLCHLPLLPKLQQLSLSGTRITGEAFDQLVHLQELQVLQCKGCNLLTDTGLVLLCRLLGLRELDVSDCSGLSDNGLLAVMLNAAGLIRVDVRGCRLLTRDVVRRCPYHVKLLHSL